MSRNEKSILNIKAFIVAILTGAVAECIIIKYLGDSSSWFNRLILFIIVFVVDFCYITMKKIHVQKGKNK